MSDTIQTFDKLSRVNAFFSNRWLILCIRLLLGGVFLYAGFLKMRDPLAFADSIASFRILPNSIINLLALGLPPLEMSVGAMLVIGWRIRLASFAVLLLSMIFALALGQALIRGLEVDCGCFGSGKPSLIKTLLSLGRDILLIAASVWLYTRYVLHGRPSVCAEGEEKK